MNELNKNVLLLDFYGNLLTESQYKCLDMYCNDDMSLAEIAEYMGISRQGVHDFIKRGKAALQEYEDKLGLVRRFEVTRDKLSEMRAELELSSNNIKDEMSKEVIRKALKDLESIASKL